MIDEDITELSGSSSPTYLCIFSFTALANVTASHDLPLLVTYIAQLYVLVFYFVMKVVAKDLLAIHSLSLCCGVCECSYF